MQSSDANHENLKNLIAEKCRVINLYKDLSAKQQKVRNNIADLYYKIDKRQFTYVEKPTFNPDISLLEDDINYAKQELERSVQEKEIITKDLAILQLRLKFLENEITKTKSWWQQLFTPMQ
jgi:predicted  nucleic acid-binding Zn-ribbon protein